jgi:hypothetical protein
VVSRGPRLSGTADPTELGLRKILQMNFAELYFDVTPIPWIKLFVVGCLRIAQPLAEDLKQELLLGFSDNGLGLSVANDLGPGVRHLFRAEEYGLSGELGTVVDLGHLL